MRVRSLLGCLTALGLAGLGFAWGCGAFKKAASSAASAVPIAFSGTVKTVNGSKPISGALVYFIEMLDATAITKLVSTKDVDDGKGGTKTIVRVDSSKMHAFVNKSGNIDDDHKTTTGSDGKFAKSVPLGAYVVYVEGPAQAKKAEAYGIYTWGINPVTGELDKDHIIGHELLDPNKLSEQAASGSFPDQINNDILLSGGPTPPPSGTPAPATAGPAASVDKSSTAVEETAAPTPSSGTWTSIKVTYAVGGADATKDFTTTNVTSVPAVTGPGGAKPLLIEGVLASAPTGSVYLVLQTGFDSFRVSNCSGKGTAVADTKVIPVNAQNGTFSYYLVPPGPFYQFYFATGASKTKGQPVTGVSGATGTVTIGERSCATNSPIPSRPFMAALTWDKGTADDPVDLDIYVTKYKITNGVAATDPYDQANFSNKDGMSPGGVVGLSLDLDNTQGFGPENNGDSAAETNPNGYCYTVAVNYYAGAQDTNFTVNVTHVVTGATTDKTLANPYTVTGSFKSTEVGAWKQIGIYGDATICGKLVPSS